jgi:hypothetical protein
MDGRRLRFTVALTLFVLWIAALGLLALKSSSRPMPVTHRPAAIIPR